jgi:hypothetical protein
MKDFIAFEIDEKVGLFAARKVVVFEMDVGGMWYHPLISGQKA